MRTAARSERNKSTLQTRPPLPEANGTIPQTRKSPASQANGTIPPYKKSPASQANESIPQNPRIPAAQGEHHPYASAAGAKIITF